MEKPCSTCGNPFDAKGRDVTCGEVCRRARAKWRASKRYTSTVGSPAACQRCGKSFVKQSPWQRLCWSPCRPHRSGGEHAASNAERGYGSEHQKARKAAREAWQNGDPCARCGGPMFHGTPVDLDHTDDRSGYLGLSHASCNRSRTQRLDSVRVDKVCDHCGTTYRTKWRAQRFCSVPCRKSGMAADRARAKPKPKPKPKPPVLRACLVCQTPHARRLYCSVECNSKAQWRKRAERLGCTPRSGPTAAEWLVDYLLRHPHALSTNVKRDGLLAGFAPGTLKKSRAELGIISVLTAPGGPARWSLPGEGTPRAA